MTDKHKPIWFPIMARAAVGFCICFMAIYGVGVVASAIGPIGEMTKTQVYSESGTRFVVMHSYSSWSVLADQDERAESGWRRDLSIIDRALLQEASDRRRGGGPYLIARRAYGWPLPFVVCNIRSEGWWLESTYPSDRLSIEGGVLLSDSRAPDPRERLKELRILALTPCVFNIAAITALPTIIILGWPVAVKRAMARLSRSQARPKDRTDANAAC
jgi:hypothetical protein